MGNNVYIVNKIDSIMGLKRLLKRKKYSSKVFLNGKEVKGTETIKEGDSLVNIDKIEGEVYKFQSGISWNGVDSTFKEKVIKAMCELYCVYKEKGKSWTVLEISSAYRDASHQSRVMVEESHIKRNKLVDEYVYKDSMRLLVHLYNNGDLLTHDPILFHKNQNLILFNEYDRNPDKYTPSNESLEQYNLYNKISNYKEKAAFDRYFSFSLYRRIYNNTDAMIEFLILWFYETGYKFPHMRNTAIDFSSRNKGTQQELFRNILENYNINMNKKNYSSGNFHIDI